MITPGVDRYSVAIGKVPRGAWQVPGDKSITQRAVLLSALAAGFSRLTGFPAAEDCRATLAAVEKLGCRIRRTGPQDVEITGRGGTLATPSETLYLGNSGTGMRLLAGVLAAQPMTCELTGDASLSRRPMQRIRDPLQRMGARIELLGADGCAPLRIHGGDVRGIEYTMPVASAQVKSSILLAGLYAEGETCVVEPLPSRDHTERMLLALGRPLRQEGLKVILQGAGPRRPALPAAEWSIPGDFSSAAFLLGVAAGRPGAEITVHSVGLNPRRAALLDVLRRMGAEIESRLDPGSEACEPQGDVFLRGGSLQGVTVGGEDIPALIDELPLVAVLGALAHGETVIRDAAELRVKESDRIEVMAENLRAAGVPVETMPDGMVIRGPLTGGGPAHVHSRGDHRMAMAMAVLGTYCREPLTISGCRCTETSFPGFWEILERIGADVH